MTALADETCRPLSGPAHRLDESTQRALLTEVPGWDIVDAQLAREFHFADFHATMAFIHAMASLAHDNDHHPDFAAGYNYCRVRFSTHDVGGLSRNDFICAAQLNRLRDGAQ